MFPRLETLSVIPRCFEELRNDSIRARLMVAENRKHLLWRQSLIVPNLIALECIARHYLTVNKVLFDNMAALRFVHFTGSVFESGETADPVSDEIAWTKGLLNLSIGEGSSQFLERKDIETIRRVTGLERLEMDGRMKLSGFTFEGLESAGWIIRMS